MPAQSDIFCKLAFVCRYV